MRSFSLVCVAAEAEALRLRRLAWRTGVRAAVAGFAMIFLLAALVIGHLAIWLALQPQFSVLAALLIVCAGDLVIALLLLVLAVRSAPGPVEREARLLREAARQELMQEAGLLRVFGTVWSLVRNRTR